MKIGYIRITLPDGSRELEHRWVWEQAHGPIPPGALIHHINEDKTDNRLENLKMVESLSAHMAEHGGALRDTWPAPAPTQCHPDRPHRALGLCQPCYSKHYAERNKERILANGREYRARNRERKAEYDRQLRARKAADAATSDPD